MPDMELPISDEFIRLGQAMKLCGAADSGVTAKLLIQDGKVTVNGEICTQRGKKLYSNDSFSFEGHDYHIRRTS